MIWLFVFRRQSIRGEGRAGRTVLLRDDGLDELDAVDGTERVVLLALHIIMDTPELKSA